MVCISVKTLNNENVLASRHTEREKASLSLDIRRSKTLLLKLPIYIPLVKSDVALYRTGRSLHHHCTAICT